MWGIIDTILSLISTFLYSLLQLWAMGRTEVVVVLSQGASHSRIKSIISIERKYITLPHIFWPESIQNNRFHPRIFRTLGDIFLVYLSLWVGNSGSIKFVIFTRISQNLPELWTTKLTGIGSGTTGTTGLSCWHTLVLHDTCTLVIMWHHTLSTQHQPQPHHCHITQPSSHHHHANNLLWYAPLWIGKIATQAGIAHSQACHINTGDGQMKQESKARWGGKRGTKQGDHPEKGREVCNLTMSTNGHELMLPRTSGKAAKKNRSGLTCWGHPTKESFIISTSYTDIISVF